VKQSKKMSKKWRRRRRRRRRWSISDIVFKPYITAFKSSQS